eukprot:9283628-Pyramimonas_sp.AAC.1
MEDWHRGEGEHRPGIGDTSPIDRRLAPDSVNARFWAGWAMGPLSATNGRLGGDASPPMPIPPL